MASVLPQVDRDPVRTTQLGQDRGAHGIGFVGAPFTLCSYVVQGSRSREANELKAFLWAHPAAWDRLASFWADHLAEFAIAQHEAGAAAIQVFDSWAGTLAPEDYETRALPYSRRLFERLETARVPSIHFFTGNPAACQAEIPPARL